MSGSSNAGDLLEGGAGRWAVALCVVVVLVALVPIGLTALGFSAIMAIAGGLSGNPSTGAGGQMLTNRTSRMDGAPATNMHRPPA